MSSAGHAGVRLGALLRFDPAAIRAWDYVNYTIRRQHRWQFRTV